MLVLSRKIGEKIVVGDGITITVLAARNGRARLGLTAPKETRIDREEIEVGSNRQRVADLSLRNAERRQGGMGAGELDMVLRHDVNERRTAP